jgi:crotonobetainyl-CoA:carnitine CoA-transferase CaiB-like acyl-CoA transferase
MVVPLEHPAAGTIRVNGVPIKLSKTPGKVTDPPPLLGQQTDAILSEILGYTPAEIAELRQLQAI